MSAFLSHRFIWTGSCFGPKSWTKNLKLAPNLKMMNQIQSGSYELFLWNVQVHMNHFSNIGTSTCIVDFLKILNIPIATIHVNNGQLSLLLQILSSYRSKCPLVRLSVIWSNFYLNQFIWTFPMKRVGSYELVHACETRSNILLYNCEQSWYSQANHWKFFRNYYITVVLSS